MILTTRLKEDNIFIQKKLKSKQIKVMGESLFKISFRSHNIKPNNKKIFIVASKQTVRFIQHKKLIKELRSNIFFAIGKQTSLKLKKLGLKVKIVTQNSNELISKIKSSKRYKNYNFEYLCGSEFNEFFLKELKKQKISIKKNVVYDLIPNTNFSSSTVSNLKKEKIKMVLVFSKFGFKIFLRLLQKHKINKDYLKTICFLTMSREISDSLLTRGFHSNWSKKAEVQSIIKAAKVIYKSL